MWSFLSVRVKWDILGITVLNSIPIHCIFPYVCEKCVTCASSVECYGGNEERLTWVKVNGLEYSFSVYNFTNFLTFTILHFLVIQGKASKNCSILKKFSLHSKYFVITFCTFRWNYVIFLIRFAASFFFYLRLQEVHFPQAWLS